MSSLRDRYNAFIVRHEVAWELTMGVLAVVFVVVGFAADAASDSGRPMLQAIDLALTVIFVAEFSTRFLASYDRRGYLHGHWVDLIALIPAVREIRVLRLLRLLRLVRMFAGLFRALGHLERVAKHRGLAWLFVTWLAVMVLTSAALYLAEHGVNATVASPFDALWWGVVTLTTVGYGDVVPKTIEGRAAAMILMLLGIGLFSAITATLTSFMLASRVDQRAGAPNQLQMAQLLHEDGLLTDDELATIQRRVFDRPGGSV